MAPSGPLSLCLAGNSWLPRKDVWCMLVYGAAQQRVIHSCSIYFFKVFFWLINGAAGIWLAFFTPVYTTQA